MSRHYGGTEVTAAERMARWLVWANWGVVLLFLFTVIDEHFLKAAGSTVRDGSLLTQVFGVLIALAFYLAMHSLIYVVIGFGLLFCVLSMLGRWASPRTGAFWWSVGPAIAGIALLLVQYQRFRP